MMVSAKMPATFSFLLDKEVVYICWKKGGVSNNLVVEERCTFPLSDFHDGVKMGTPFRLEKWELHLDWNPILSG